MDVLSRLVAGIGLSQGTKKEADALAVTRFPTVGWGRGMGDPMDGSDGRLPAIREDKSYPRRTMEYVTSTARQKRGLTKCSAQDVQNMAELNSESPALGSPPVSHFQDEEPIKYDKPPAAEIKKGSEDAAALPANLETRRKKRESGTKLTIRRMSVFNSPEEQVKDGAVEERPSSQVLPIRAGAKRKLGSREDDGKASTDFTFSRKASGSSESADESSAKEDKTAREPVKTFSRRDINTRGAPPRLIERKALGEKSINTDPVVSPKKPARKQDDKDALKKPAKPTEEPPKIRAIRDRESRVALDDCVTILPPTISPPETDTDTKTDLPPKTPAAPEDVFSAPSTESSARPQAGRDTPPPGDLSSAGANDTARPGRRARAQVNYAEPSLTAKMRRPTKELLDAVGRDGRVQSGMIVRKDGVEVKSEDLGSAWKCLPSTTASAPKGVKTEEPGSPLSKKAINPDDVESLHFMRAEPEPILPSAASQAIAALIKDSKTSAANARRRSSALQQRAETAGTESDKQNENEEDKRGSSIYDFSSSSPPRSTRPPSRSSDREGEEAPPRLGRASSRRHSSVPSLATTATSAGTSSTSSSTRGTARFAPSSAAAGVGHKRTVSGTGVDASASAPATEAAKTDLRASRRRSMML